jgi:hypothetical protein
MQRREFIALIGTIGAVWPRSLVAQPADQLMKKMPRVGFLRARAAWGRADAADRRVDFLNHAGSGITPGMSGHKSAIRGEADSICS